MRTVYQLAFFTLLIAALGSCNIKNQNNPGSATTGKWCKEITATAETDPIPGETGVDAADDPAIWYNLSDPANSLILGTNKKGGIAVYNLNGRMVRYFEIGLPNNLDIRNSIKQGDKNIDIVAFSDRADSTIKLYSILPGGELSSLSDSHIKPGFIGEIYGFCLYRPVSSGNLYAVANSKEGEIEQWMLDFTGGQLKTTLTNKYKIPSQTEGMVADDHTGILYVGEEDGGIWSIDLNKEGDTRPALIESSALTSNNKLKADIEGLAIYYSAEGGYLIASSQGNNTYAIFDRMAPNRYIGSFKTVEGIVDSTEDTDGLDVLNLPLNNIFPAGILVVQDGSNTETGGDTLPQNFKLIRWDKISESFNDEVIIDTVFRVNNN
jgi:3-phytase